METSGGIQASLSGRYATALFGLAHDQNSIAAVATSLDTVKAALDESADFRALIANPLISRSDATSAVAAVGKALAVDGLTANFLGVLAQNRRLAALGNVIADFGALAAAHRGEVTAQVTSAHALDSAQVEAIKAQLKTTVGRDVAVSLTTDPAILGGLIVKIGSRMIDSSIRTRLNTLAHAMKG
ncbi:MAG: F0F1 ATP synthase subunit delta [Sphingomonadaceae bacterium]